MKSIYIFLMKRKNSNFLSIILFIFFILYTITISLYFPDRRVNWGSYINGVIVTLYFLCLIVSIYFIPIIKNKLLLYIAILMSTFIVGDDFLDLSNYFNAPYCFDTYYFNCLSLGLKIFFILITTCKFFILNIIYNHYVGINYKKIKFHFFKKINYVTNILLLILIFVMVFFKNYEKYIIFYAMFLIFSPWGFVFFYKKFFYSLLMLNFLLLWVFYGFRFFGIFEFFSTNYAVRNTLIFSETSILISSVLNIIQIFTLVIYSLRFFKIKNIFYASKINMHKLVLIESQLKATNFELSFLTSAVKPHFLFNCLNSIEILMSIDVSKSQEFIYNLSYFYRYYLINLKEKLVWINDELKFVESYVKMENVRFGDRIILSVESESNFQFKVPPMTIQLIVENAIIYSITKSKNVGKILIKIMRFENYHEIKISNKKEYSEMNPYDKKGSGVGIKLLSRRLELIFGKKFIDLTIHNSEYEYSISFFVPNEYVYKGGGV